MAHDEPAPGIRPGLVGYRVPRAGDVAYRLFEQVLKQFGTPYTDLTKYQNQWPDLTLGGLHPDYIVFTPLTPAGDLWLLANLPEGSEPAC